MTKKPKRRWETTPFSDLLKKVPKLPDAHTLQETGLPLSDRELQLVRHAMAVHTASRQPQLTWEGWKLVGAAVEIGTYHAERLNRGPIVGRNVPLTSFLRATGFTFINKGVRSNRPACCASGGKRPVASSSRASNAAQIVSRSSANQAAARSFRLSISLRTGEGVSALLKMLQQKVQQKLECGDGAPPLTRPRHRHALQEAAAALQHGLDAPQDQPVSRWSSEKSNTGVRSGEEQKNLHSQITVYIFTAK